MICSKCGKEGIYGYSIVDSNTGEETKYSGCCNAELINDKPRHGYPAFPVNKELNNYPDGFNGMTLRDYFAAKAMQGMLAEGTLCAIEGNATNSMEALCLIAYDYADAMLKARKTKAGD